MEEQRKVAFDVGRSAMERARQARAQGFGLNKADDERGLGNILGGLASIGEDMKQHYPRISESLFVGRYLDAFAGFGESLEDNYALYLEWTQTIAKQFNIPVHICADGDDTNILFTVPAISNVQTINPQKANTREIHAAISAATDARFLQPYNWEAMLSNNLVGIFKKVYDKQNAVTPDQEVWLGIFKRYEKHFEGRKPLEGVNEQLMVNASDNKTPVPTEGSNPSVPTNTSCVEVEEE